jgi:FtsZ-binding cell division protein ZapB
MDILQVELAKLRRDANLTQSIEDVQKIIEQLERARELIVAGTYGVFGIFRVG